MPTCSRESARGRGTTTWRVRAARVVALLLLHALAACDLYGVYPWQVKVPFEDVGAQFVLANTTWFEDEQTLFVFYEITANQGLSDASQVELTYRTDEEFVDFTALAVMTPVHPHWHADCGTRSLCGSFSVHVEREPRDVDLRLRYHRDGELFLETLVDHHTVLSGLPHLSRSAVVYGVFDADNTHVQWRLRHQFPAIRNEHAQALGLRRDFTVEDISTGTLQGMRDRLVANPYGYALDPACPASFDAHAGGPVTTLTRAVFDPVELALTASDHAIACGAATVNDALGTYTAMAIAQKNPEVDEAFSSLNTPVEEARRVPFFLKTCNAPTSELHQQMQAQRLFLVDGDIVCIDDYLTPDFSSRLAATFTERIDAARSSGLDLVLVIGLNRPNVRAIAEKVEEAIGLVVVNEAEFATPRLAGVFVYDTRPYQAANPDVRRLTLWCPSSYNAQDLDAIADTSARDCAVQPMMPIALGDIELSQLPILPTETQFENFIEKYGAGQTGNMTGMSFLAPSRTATSVNVPVGDFAVVTFFNNEAITADPGDAFSYCAEEDTGIVVARIDAFPDVFPLAFIGEVHNLIAWNRYELGLFWDFPFLMQIRYNSTLATAVDVPEEVPFVVALGISTPAEQYFGGLQWTAERFEIGRALLQCTRFCDHPTFDNAETYNVNDLFDVTYAQQCYRPGFPSLGDGGYPPDP